MNSQPVRIWSRRKTLGLSLFLALTPPAVTFAADEAADPAAQWQQAVSQYIQGATTELNVYSQQIASITHPENQAEFTDAKNKLADCEQLVAKLKAADATNFDLLKAKYEHTRTELVTALQAAQKT